MRKPRISSKISRSVKYIEELHSELNRANSGLLALTGEMEERVARRTEQLEAVNAELESFGYSVSHDLRQPLRVIEGFSQALLEEFQDRLDDVGVDYLVRICRGTRRMGDLIDDLLNLSRITISAIQKTDIKLSEISRTVISQLLESDPERKVKVHIPDGLNAHGDSRLMHVAMENLLGNAWKFTANNPDAEIEMGSVERKREQVYFVRDNGAGFNTEYADKLFGAFQRLHQESEFPGTGIGLATVQRIIRKHGGNIWAESEVGKGATFYFSL